ncbi:hypothetical protein [Thomasclavelia cocleata]|uniref:hypothetical protein n=1 Tax=Thomasclavelia cocleata TaxID=69824 RepID=UPI00242C3CA7|nr:hypothetical protein [Thomasclavelia cocleata]
MDLKKYLGKKYKEGMTFEEIQQALADLPEPDSVVDKEEYDKIKKLKDEASKEASSWKKKYNSTLSEKEQLEIAQNEANEELQNNYDALLRKTTIAERKAELVELGYDAKLAQETAEAMADGDFSKVIANQSKFAESVKKNTTDELLKNTKTPEGGSGNEGITRESIKKMSLQERQELYKNDPETFKQIVKGE